MKLQAMQCSCGSDWFEVVKLVRPAGFPLPPFFTELASSTQPRYRYRCADCGGVYGNPKDEPKAEAKTDEPEAESPKDEDKPAPKKRGRPPKNTNK